MSGKPGGLGIPWPDGPLLGAAPGPFDTPTAERLKRFATTPKAMFFIKPDPPRRPPVWAWVTAMALLFAALALLARAAL